ncbi:hypothetical protein OG458_22920 [Streptomyces sp. NBC_01281]|uniref:hypothetical protein n=1 Tax=unclassified Streptomyces TaxID=2593676 RepID=UPI002E12F2C8|nr:hypothetical protein OG458_22920 [Streptomyces sp. NBC_01281]
MSNQPFEGRYEGAYEEYDPYRQPQQESEDQQSPAQGQQQGHGQQQQGQGQPDWQQHTQQWEGRTWETQTHSSVSAADTAYLPPQAYPAYGEPQQGPQGYGGAVGDPSEAPAQPWTPAAEAPAQEPAAEPVGVRLRPDGIPLADATPAEVAADATSDYGPATVTGNARITDAQRARAEGRSPIIEPGMQPAALTAVLALLLSGAAAIGAYALVVPLVLLQGVTAAGWFRLNGMWPARQGIALAFAGALTADVALLAAGRENAPAAILGTLGVWVLLTLVLQLRSHADPDTRMYGLMATVASAALAIIATGHLAAEPDAVTVGCAAVAVAILARALPLPTPASVVVALLAAAGAGIAVGGMTDLGSQGAFLGLGAGVCALIGHRAASYDYPSRFVHFTAGVALPLAAAAPAVYLLGRALG